MQKPETAMKLRDFARYVNHALKQSETDGNEPVIVSLNGRYEGKRTYTNIRFVGRGREEDGEEGEIRIETAKKINAEQFLSRDVPRKPYVRQHGTSKEIRCGKCNAELRRKDSYCAHCGQKVKKEDTDKHTYTKERINR